MSHIAIIGGGVIGAAIAYELSDIKGVRITLLEQESPASGASGAALGVLMGVMSRKTKGRAWRLREESLHRYRTLIPELEAITGEIIPQNQQGIVSLQFSDADQGSWEKLQQLRQAQGWQLEWWDRDRLGEKCPHLDLSQIVGAIYSPCDRQIHPARLTESLITAAQYRGVDCQFGVTVKGLMANHSLIDDSSRHHCTHLSTSQGELAVDWVIMAAGLGSMALMPPSSPPLILRPVLGQALHIKCDRNLGNAIFQPVITGKDVHIVPIAQGEYWVGATVEFPDEANGSPIPQAPLLEQLHQTAIAFCPALASGQILRHWWGNRPRPEGQSAPILRPLEGYNNVLLATGHYRNGILLAPATALTIKTHILSNLSQ